MIYLILFLGLILRLINFNQSLWLDEAIGANVVKNLNLSEMFTKFFVVDNHPPLYYILLKFWTNIFGLSEISLRMPSIFFGVGVVYLVYLITKKISSHNSIHTAILVATSPFLVYYSQEARMYMMAAFFAALATCFYLNKKFLLFSISVTVLAFTDYVPIFLLPVFIFYAVYKKENIVKVLLSYLPIAVMGFFWLPYFAKQLEGGKILLATFPAWREVAGGANLKQIINLWSKFVLGRISFYNKWLYGFVVLISSTPIVYSLILSLKNKRNILLWMWLIIPLTLCFMFSFITPAFIYFRFIFVVPAFYMLLNLKNKHVFYLILGVNLIGLSIYILDTNQHREDWKTAVKYIESRIESNEIVVFENTEPFAPYQYYEKKPDISFGAINRIPAEKSIITDHLTNKNGVYYFEYLGKLQDKDNLVIKDLKNNGFFEVDKKAFNGVGFVTYFRKINPYAYSN